jgi:thiol peroxidase
METKRFNEEAAALDPDIVIVTVSTDLPYALKNWCAANGIERVQLYSDAYDTNFGQAYGTLIKDRRILRRAVFVTDRKGKVVYADYMKALGDQPNYEAVLAAAKGALAP